MKTILLVDDHSANLLFLEELLQSELKLPEFQCIKAESAIDALGLIKANTVDLVITDLSMPKMDGQQFSKLLKGNPSTRHIPIIIASAFHAYKVQYADAFWVKGSDVCKLIELVDIFLKKGKIDKAINFIKMKTFVAVIFIQGCLVFSGRFINTVNAAQYKNVKHEKGETGKAGDILMNTGNTQSGNSIGEWVSSGTFKGDDGADGANGVDGENGIKGTNGADGLQGTAGTPADMSKVSVNAKAISANASQIADNSGRISKLEKTQVVIEGQVRVYDGKKWKVKLFASFSTTQSKFDKVGIKFTYKLGKSYEEQLIEEQLSRLEKVEKQLGIENCVKGAYDLAQECLENECRIENRNKIHGSKKSRREAIQEKENLEYAEKNYTMKLGTDGTWLIERKF